MTSQLFWAASNIGPTGNLAAETPRILRADLVNPDGTPTTTVINRNYSGQRELNKNRNPHKRFSQSI